MIDGLIMSSSALNYNAEVSSELVKLLFPILVISDSHTLGAYITWIKIYLIYS